MIKEYDYDNLAKYYKILEEDKKEDLKKNKFIENILKRYNVKKVFDVSCGTGVQAIYLCKKGYDVKASDLSKGMLKIARERSRKEGLNINFRKADMTNVKSTSKEDCVISIFNAIGHLSKKQFEKMVKNTYNNLNKEGIFIFDIFNLDFFKKNMITHEFIDVAKTVDNTYFVRFNHNKLDVKDGKICVNQKLYIQEGFNKSKIINEKWDMKLYDYKTLEKILKNNGFKVIEKYGGCNKTKLTANSNSIYIVAKKK